jgi:hypothetical protein
MMGQTLLYSRYFVACVLPEDIEGDREEENRYDVVEEQAGLLRELRPGLTNIKRNHKQNGQPMSLIIWPHFLLYSKANPV